MECQLRFQFVLPDKALWIGHLEVRNEFRRQRLGSRVVCSVEVAARASGIRTRYRVRQFWQKFG